MPDAWTILKENSSLDSGDAWEHLNNQEIGGETLPCEGLVLIDGLEVLVEDRCFEVELESTEVVVEIDEGFVVYIEFNEYEVEVC